MKEVLSELHKQFNIGTAQEHLVVADDAKTYQHLQSLKLDYGNELPCLPSVNMHDLAMHAERNMCLADFAPSKS